MDTSEEATDKANGSRRPSAEEQLRDLQEKTNLWKQSVAQQLSEATKKNKQLRDELKQVNANHGSEMGALRVQLEKEFRERTSLKDEELQNVQTQLMELRKEKRSMVEQHERDLKQAIARVRETCAVEHTMRTDAETQQHEAELHKLRDAMELKEKELALSEHEVCVMKTRLERLAEQYRELSALMTQNTTQLESGGDAANKEKVLENALKASDAAHQQQLETVRSEMSNLEERHAAKLREMQRAHELEQQRYMNEVYQREEQLATLQTLLHQAQHEAEAAQRRISNVRLEREQMEQQLTERVAGLSRELASRMEYAQQLAAEVNSLQRELGRQEGLVRSLEEEANMREEAFQTLLLSEENRALVMGLQEALQKSRDDAEAWARKYEEAVQQTKSTCAVPIGYPCDGNDGDERKFRELAQREKALEEENLRLQTKAKLLRAMELRLEELKRSMASQASTILEHHNSGNRGSRMGDVRYGEERKGSRSASPLRRMQLMWNQHSSVSGRLSRCAFELSRCRLPQCMLLFAFCVASSLIIFVVRSFSL